MEGRLCPKPTTETIFNSVVSGLFAEGRIPDGSIVDAGGFTGDFACWYARLTPRPVHAIEPNMQNVQYMARRYSKTTNLQPMQGGLGSTRKVLSTGRQGFASQMQGHSSTVGLLRALPVGGRNLTLGAPGTFEVRRLDELFETRWPAERLGFLHLDVQGSELDALRGAAATILRDRPIFSTEVEVHANARLTASLLRFIDELGYDSYLVEEHCGTPRQDCRNLLNLPRALHAEEWHSGALDLAVGSRSMFRVDGASIGKHAFPCCARGGECCRGAADCCGERAAYAWLEGATRRWLDASGVERNATWDPRLYTRTRYRQKTVGRVPLGTFAGAVDHLGPGNTRTPEPRGRERSIGGRR